MNEWTPLDWMARFDWWRDHYDTLTDTEQKDYFEAVGQAFPGSSESGSFSPQIYNFLGDVEDIRKRGVVEVGGWMGAMARKGLELYPDIPSWTNIEFSPVAVKNTDVPRKRYHVINPAHYRWWLPGQDGDIPKDTLVGAGVITLAHVIEHVRWIDFKGMMDWLIRETKMNERGGMIYLEAPFAYHFAPFLQGSNPREWWRGYYGTHVSDFHWDAIPCRGGTLHQYMELNHGAKHIGIVNKDIHEYYIQGGE